MWAVMTMGMAQAVGQSAAQAILKSQATWGDGVERLDGNSNISMGSWNLAMGSDGLTGRVLTALRFEDLPLASGATIDSAWIQFTANQEGTEPALLTIHGELATAPARLDFNAGNFSSRNRTSASVAWPVEPWFLIGRDGPDQRTPDIAPILREIVGQPEWQRGGDVVLMMEGTGNRVASSASNPNWTPPQLIVHFSNPPARTQGISGLFINEVSTSWNTVPDETGEYSDWIELYNAGDVDIPCDDLFLSDREAEPLKWALSPQLVIPAGGYLRLWADGDTRRGIAHGPFALSASGETLILSIRTPDSTITVDQVVLPDLHDVPAYGRITDGASEWSRFGIATPGEPNSPENAWMAAPVISPLTGKYQEPVTVTLTSDVPDSSIFYTTDGSTPDSSSTPYSGPFEVDSSASIRAIAMAPGMADSAAASATYIIGETNHLPVVALTIDPKDLFSDEEGIYVKGTNGLAENCDFEPANWNQEWEKPADITWIEKDGTIGFSISAGVEISGQCTRRFRQKTLQIKTKSRWGDPEINYPLFPGRSQQTYRRFKLRGSGNDWASTLFRDGFVHDYLEKAGIDLEVMGYRPVEVYINGQFWGIHNVRDAHSKHSINEKFPGVDKDLIDVVKKYDIRHDNYTYRVQTGAPDEFRKLYRFLEENSLADTGNWETIRNWIDFDSAVNYHIVQIFVGNHDWPDSNVGLWRENKPFEKWRFLLFDLDDGFGFSDTGKTEPSYNSLRDALDGESDVYPISAKSTLMFRRLMESEEFRNEYVQRMATMMDLLFITPERVLPAIDSTAQVIEPVIERHSDFWINFEAEAFVNANYGHLFQELDLGIENTVDGIVGWKDEVEGFKFYWGARIPEVRRHVQEVLGIDGTFRLDITNPNPEMGRVLVNSNRMPLPQEYTGIYFSNVPLRLEASPLPGYRFVRWVETGGTSPVLQLTSSSDMSLTPEFVLDPVDLNDFRGLVISEINYNPGQTGYFEQEELEYLEFSNLGTDSIDLSGVEVGGAFDPYVFPQGVSLSPGGALLLVRNPVAFKEFRNSQTPDNFRILGPWPGGKLSNGGETIRVQARDGQLLFEVTYGDDQPWPAPADGSGPTLQLTNLKAVASSPGSMTAILSDPANWIASADSFGTPGTIYPQNEITFGITMDGDLSEWPPDAMIAEDSDDPQDPSNPIDVRRIYFRKSANAFHFGFVNDGTIDLNYSWSSFINSGKGNTTYKVWDMAADFLIQNETVYRYAGEGDNWDWEPVGAVSVQQNGSLIETSIPAAVLPETGSWHFLFVGDNAAYGGSRIEFVPDRESAPFLTLRFPVTPESFFTPQFDGNIDEWAAESVLLENPASAETPGGQVVRLLAAHDNDSLYFAAESHLQLAAGQPTAIWMDIDMDISTGLTVGDSGFDFLVEDSALFAFTSTGAGSPSWIHVGNLESPHGVSSFETAVPWELLGNPGQIRIRYSQASENGILFTPANASIVYKVDFPDTDSRPDNPGRDTSLNSEWIGRTANGMTPAPTVSTTELGVINGGMEPRAALQVPASGNVILEKSLDLISWSVVYSGKGLPGATQVFEIHTSEYDKAFFRLAAP